MRRFLRRWPLLARRRRATPIGAREGYRRWAATYGARPNEFQRLEAEILAAELPPVEGLRVLDLGCGRGRVSELVTRRGASRAVGVDSALGMLTRDAGRPSRWGVAADLGALPFGSESFDVAIAALCLGHVESLERAVAEAGRVLRSQGLLVVSDFHPEATRRGMQRTFVDARSGELFALEQHLHRLEDYSAVLRRNGLSRPRVVESHYRGAPMVFVLSARKLEPAGSWLSPFPSEP